MHRPEPQYAGEFLEQDSRKESHTEADGRDVDHDELVRVV
jgi:hypothetical protein